MNSAYIDFSRWLKYQQYASPRFPQFIAKHPDQIGGFPISIVELMKIQRDLGDCESYESIEHARHLKTYNRDDVWFNSYKMAIFNSYVSIARG